MKKYAYFCRELDEKINTHSPLNKSGIDLLVFKQESEYECFPNLASS